MRRRRNVAVWDPRRNTSKVHAVPPNAGPEALIALERWRLENPKHAAWIAEGAPRLTRDEHRARFGCDWAPASSPRGRVRA